MANPLLAFFKSPLFTWWNSPTLGTRLFTSRKGVKVGEDDSGNVYYETRDGAKRWVIYKNGPIEASRVPAEWHGWLHKTVQAPPTENPPVVKDWEKPHVANLTGSDEAYAPPGSLSKAGERAASTGDYEAWQP